MWHRIADLKIQEGHEQKSSRPILWSHGGISEVVVEAKGMLIPIPEEALVKLIAQEYISRKIRELEDLTPQQAFEQMMR